MTKEKEIHDMITGIADGKIPESLEDKTACLKELQKIRETARELEQEEPTECECCGRKDTAIFLCDGCGKNACYETCATSVYDDKGGEGKMFGTFCLDCMVKIFSWGNDFAIGRSPKCGKSPEKIAEMRERINKLGY